MVASISTVSSASAARSYYGKDNYYAKGKDAPEPSQWFGKGAAGLDLRGGVDPDTFERVLSGATLDGRRIGQRSGETLEQAANRTHRPGFDLTFSPPKDVSLLLYLGGDKRILNAHRTAVDRTLKWAERNLAGTRIRPDLPNGKKGEPEPVKTGNLVAAKFEHDISRDKDPQLHTHCVVANMTKDAGGTWRALHNDPFFRHRKTLSLAYDAEMREALRGLGYKVTLTDGKAGSYQVDGVPEAAREEFSKGRARIDRAAETLDNPTPKARDVLAVTTRPSKTTMSQDERQASWEARGAPWKAQLEGAAADAQLRGEAGRLQQPLNCERVHRDGLGSAITRFAQNRFRPTRTLRLEANDPYRMERAGSEREYAARSAASFALRKLEEREAAFSLHHVRRAALEHGADGLRLGDIDKELRLLRRSGKLTVKANDPDGLATTRRSVSHEKRTLALVESAGKTGPLLSAERVRSSLASTGLTPGQKTAAETILSGENRLVGVQGYAGTGKTTMMRHTKELTADLKPAAAKAGYDIVGLAPTHAARRELEESLGIEAQTVAGFLGGRDGTGRNGDLSRSIVIVDESSFLSTRMMNRLLGKLLDRRAARIVLAGDQRQHGAVEAGRPFAQAQEAGMTTAVMRDVVRLPKDAAYDDRRRAVIEAGTGKVAQAMKRLEGNIAERPDGDLAQSALEAWQALPKERQDEALIVTPGHRWRNVINNKVRGAMIADGRLGAEATTLSVLESKGMTKAEAASPRSYEEGDVLSFHRRLDAVNAKAGASRIMVSVDEEHGLVTLRNSKGGLYTVKASDLAGRFDSPAFSLARQKDLELRDGDRLAFTRTDRDAEVTAQQPAQVVCFDEESVTLRTVDGERRFARDDPALTSLTHAYAVTTHAAQGRTATDVVAVIDSREKSLSSQPSFYVGISRSADTLTVVTDDSTKATSALQRNAGIQASAIAASKSIEDLTGLNRPSTTSERAPEPSLADQREDAAAQPDASGYGQDFGRDQDIGL